MAKIDKKIYEMLKSEAQADKNKALLSLELLGNFQQVSETILQKIFGIT